MEYLYSELKSYMFDSKSIYHRQRMRPADDKNDLTNITIHMKSGTGRSR